MLNAEVHSLLDEAVADDLVHDNANSGGGDVVHNTGAARKNHKNISTPIHHRLLEQNGAPVVVFVGHALLLRSVSLDVNNVSYMVVDEESGHLDGAML